MKLIINSQYLQQGIARALNNKPISVDVTPEKILFNCLGVTCEVEIHKSSVKDPEEFNVAFDFIQWQRILKLTNLIPEQPIILDINEYEDGLRIEINGMCAIF